MGPVDGISEGKLVGKILGVQEGSTVAMLGAVEGDAEGFKLYGEVVVVGATEGMVEINTVGAKEGPTEVKEGVGPCVGSTVGSREGANESDGTEVVGNKLGCKLLVGISVG